MTTYDANSPTGHQTPPEETLSTPTKPTKPVSEIYEGYCEIKNNTPRRGTGIWDQVAHRFGITRKAFAGMKVVYEEAQAGGEYAQELIARIDDGDLTPSQAYTLLDQHRKELARRKDLPTRVQLETLWSTAIRTNAYAETIAAALRHDVKISPGSMSAEDQADCIRQVRAAGLRLKWIAEALARTDIGKV
jgi:hypothetical protein